MDTDVLSFFDDHMDSLANRIHGSGSLILPITGETVMILMQDGRMVLQVCAARRLWINLRSRKNG